MNERIRQLAEQATICYSNGQERTFDKEKFAELIVRECVKAVMDGTKEGDHYAQKIEEHFDNGRGVILHFGVEE